MSCGSAPCTDLQIHKERHAAVRRSRIQDTAQQEKQQQITAAAAASLALLPEEKELGEASTKKQKT